jgi:hypothetical protein
MPDMTNVACPADCSVANLPAINFEDCNPQILASEIQALYVARKDAIDFTSVILASEWNDRISKDNTVPVGSAAAVKDLIRKLTVIGDIPAPAVTTKQISGGREIVTETKYTINFEIDDVSNENWQFAQTVQCGKGAFPVKMWPVTKSNHVLGSKTGIQGKMKIDHILPRGADGIMTLQGTVTFITTTFPNRDVFPLAA